MARANQEKVARVPIRAGGLCFLMGYFFFDLEPRASSAIRTKARLMTRSPGKKKLKDMGRVDTKINHPIQDRVRIDGPHSSKKVLWFRWTGY